MNKKAAPIIKTNLSIKSEYANEIKEEDSAVYSVLLLRLKKPSNQLLHSKVPSLTAILLASDQPRF